MTNHKYSYWESDLPTHATNTDDGDDCVAIVGKGQKWKDSHCARKMKFICRIDGSWLERAEDRVYNTGRKGVVVAVVLLFSFGCCIPLTIIGVYMYITQKKLIPGRADARAVRSEIELGEGFPEED